MRYLHILLLIILSSGTDLFAQTDQELITDTINDFIEGTVYNYPDRINSAFYPETKMFLYSETNPEWVVSSEEYASWYSRRAPGTKNNRINKILSIDIEGGVASAKLEVIVPAFGNRYLDYLLLKKLKGKWLIIAKATSAEPIPKKPEAFISKPAKEIILEGLDHPWSIVFISETDVLIAEKNGGLVRADLSTSERRTISGIPEDLAEPVLIDSAEYKKGVFPPGSHGTTQRYNAGLFEILTDPEFETNGYIYLSYSAENDQKASALKVIRAKLTGDELTEIKTLYVAGPYSHGLFHYGGGMVFGADSMLYITTGERNFYEYLNPEIPIAQDVADRRGKVIRINRDGSVPEDNPDLGVSAADGVFATGIRAAQGLAEDPVTGKLWFSEHGTIQGDELNILSKGSNYGWPNRTTGRYRTSDYIPTEIPGNRYTEPSYWWDHTVAPTGLVFYHGSEFPLWEGNLIVPGLSKGSLWRMKIEDDKVVAAEELFVNDRVRLRKAAVSPGGELYVLTDEDNGKLIRIKNLNK